MDIDLIALVQKIEKHHLPKVHLIIQMEFTVDHEKQLENQPNNHLDYNLNINFNYQMWCENALASVTAAMDDDDRIVTIFSIYKSIIESSTQMQLCRNDCRLLDQCWNLFSEYFFEGEVIHAEEYTLTIPLYTFKNSKLFCVASKDGNLIQAESFLVGIYKNDTFTWGSTCKTKVFQSIF